MGTTIASHHGYCNSMVLKYKQTKTDFFLHRNPSIFISARWKASGECFGCGSSRFSLGSLGVNSICTHTCCFLMKRISPCSEIHSLAKAHPGAQNYSRIDHRSSIRCLILSFWKTPAIKTPLKKRHGTLAAALHPVQKLKAMALLCFYFVSCDTRGRNECTPLLFHSGLIFKLTINLLPLLHKEGWERTERSQSENEPRKIQGRGPF